MQEIACLHHQPISSNLYLSSTEDAVFNLIVYTEQQLPDCSFSVIVNMHLHTCLKTSSITIPTMLYIETQKCTSPLILVLIIIQVQQHWLWKVPAVTMQSVTVYVCTKVTQDTTMFSPLPWKVNISRLLPFYKTTTSRFWLLILTLTVFQFHFILI